MRRFVLLAAMAAMAVLFTGCFGGEVASAPLPPRLTRIEFLGNQCFRITSSLGTSILTNPYAPKTGGRTLPSPLKADILLVTAERPDANNINALDNQPALMRGSVGIGCANITGVPIRGVPSYRNPDAPSADGMNLTYTWVMDGIRFCFVGNMDHLFVPDELSQIGAVDVLFAPANSLLMASERDQAIKQLRPRLLIPMGKGMWLNGEVRKVESKSFSLSREMLPTQTGTLVFFK
jgi:L-ascorbate metabolism protein UlaG (beta-lactamase superfamily)